MTGEIQTGGEHAACGPAILHTPNMQDVIATLEANRADGAFGRDPVTARSDRAGDLTAPPGHDLYAQLRGSA